MLLSHNCLYVYLALGFVVIVSPEKVHNAICIYQREECRKHGGNTLINV